MDTPKIYADFQKTNDEGYLILTTNGSVKDLESIENKHDGLKVTFYSHDGDDLGVENLICVDGDLKFNSGKDYWMGIYDQSKFYYLPKIVA